MCEKEPKHRSCTECPQYDGMVCSATNMVMGPRGLILQEEHRRGFICLDTGEAELKGDGVLEWTTEQERLRQEKGYKSVEEMWDTEGKQVKSGFRLDEDNEQLEPTLQVSNGPGPVKFTFQYDGNAKSVDDTMYHPNSATTDCIADMLHKGEGGPFTNVFTAGSPSSECPSLRDGPPQKGKIAENSHLHNTTRCSLIRNPEAHCGNCNKSHTEGDRLVCDKWGLQDILMPYRPCEKWAADPSKGLHWTDAPSLYKEGVSPKPKARAEVQQIHYVEGNGLAYVKNPPPLFTRDSNGYWEPIKPRSCTNCKGYNDPICMKMATHIGTRDEIWAKEKRDGFQCIAAMDKAEREAVITSNGCNSRKEIR